MAFYGAPVPLYTPGSWRSGSSLSHLDDSIFTGSNRKLMNAMVDFGPAIRAISSLELAILQDLGYAVTSG